MSDPVMCRSCGQTTEFDDSERYRLMKDGTIADQGRVGLLRLLTWHCPACRKADGATALPVGLQMARIQRGIARLREAGKPLSEAVTVAVESQMDEDERRRFPDFYHWRRECPTETAPYQWAPPANFGQAQ